LRIEADPDSFPTAIARQYEEALKNVGVAIPPDAIAASETTALPAGIPYKGFKGQLSAQTLMKKMIYEIKVKEQKEHPSAPLLGAHVLLAATTAQYSVAVRAFRAMGIDPEKLAEAAQEKITNSQMEG
jgi:RNA 3'-terminal phosphate cyclase